MSGEAPSGTWSPPPACRFADLCPDEREIVFTYQLSLHSSHFQHFRHCGICWLLLTKIAIDRVSCNSWNLKFAWSSQGIFYLQIKDYHQIIIYISVQIIQKYDKWLFPTICMSITSSVICIISQPIPIFWFINSLPCTRTRGEIRRSPPPTPRIRSEAFEVWEAWNEKEMRRFKVILGVVFQHKPHWDKIE